jgi:hypothetical protein
VKRERPRPFWGLRFKGGVDIWEQFYVYSFDREVLAINHQHTN